MGVFGKIVKRVMLTNAFRIMVNNHLKKILIALLLEMKKAVKTLIVFYGNRVIVRKRMQNKSHNHVMKLGAFSKCHTRSKLMITQLEGHSQKEDMSSSLDTVLKRSQLR